MPSPPKLLIVSGGATGFATKPLSPLPAVSSGRIKHDPTQITQFLHWVPPRNVTLDALVPNVKLFAILVSVISITY